MMFSWCLYIDFLALGRQSSVKWKAFFFFSICISSELLKLLEWKKY